MPGLYIAFVKRSNIWPAIIFSIIAATPLALVVDYIGTVSNIWHVPHSLFPLFLGVLPIEDYIWMLSGTFTIIMIGGLFDQKLLNKLSKKYLATLSANSALLVGLFLILYSINGKDFFVFETPLLYLILGIVFFCAPTLPLIIYFRKEVCTCIPTVICFFILTLLFEIAAISSGWWRFNSSYFLPHLTIFGKIIPLEELIFVGIVGPLMAMLLYKLVSKRSLV